MTLFPVLLSFGTDEPDVRGLEIRWLDRILKSASDIAARPRWRTVALFLAVGAVALIFASKVRINSYMIDDLRDDQPIVRDLRWIERHGFGVFQLNLFLRQTGERELHHPENLAWMARFQRWAERDSLVIKTLGLTDFMKPLRQAILDGSDSNRTLPTSVEEAGQLLFLAALQAPTFVEDVYRQEDGEAQLVVTVRDQGSAVTLPFLDRVSDFLARDPPPAGSAEVTGTVRLAQTVFAEILRSFGLSLSIAAVIIFLVIAYMLRSWRWGLVALLPNAFPLLVLAGAMKLGGFDLKPSSILVFSVAFGIAVDDTIHLLGRVRAAVNQGHSMAAAVQEGLRDSGRAIVITTVVVAAGFSLLLFSQFEALFLLGLMTIVSVVAAVAADLFALPTLLLLVSAEGRRVPVRNVKEQEA
jgi:predicted RND superfamily exporter protein